MKTQNQQVGKFLVVDDDPVFRNILCGMLEQSGHGKVLAASNGIEAFDILKRSGHNVRTIVLDLDMPHMDGFGFLKRVADFSYKYRFFIVSGLDEATNRCAKMLTLAYSMEPGIVFRKPVDYQELIAAMVYDEVHENSSAA